MLHKLKNIFELECCFLSLEYQSKYIFNHNTQNDIFKMYYKYIGYIIIQHNHNNHINPFYYTQTSVTKTC